MIKLVFPFAPKPKQSTKFFRRGNFVGTYEPTEVTSYKATIAYSFMQQQPEWKLTNNAIRIHRLWYVFAVPTSLTKKEKTQVEAWESAPTSYAPVLKDTRPDLLDNLSKGLIDALSGIAWKDDGQIVMANGLMKCYGLQPRTELWFEVIE